jgi:hypothetical protein
LPFAQAGAIVLMAIAAYVVSGLVEVWVPWRVLNVPINLVVFAAVAVAAARRFNILSFNDLVASGVCLIKARRGATE